MKKGFTLIELLIVIAIIAILALIAIPNFLEAQTRSKVARVQADMRTVATAIEAYTVDYNFPPMAYTQTGDEAWQAYSQFFYAQTPDGSPYHVSTCLTTPVAYITGILPLDPFVERQVMEELSIDRVRCSFYYINITGGYYASKRSGWTGCNNISGPTEEIKFNGASGRAYRINWAMFSPGPDRSIRDPRVDTGADGNLGQAMLNNAHWNLLRQGSTALYDPTNGTVSRGNIWRLSGGGPQ